MKVEIFTDGGCEPNPGAGAWAAIVREGGCEARISGFERRTTNNRMEMTAAIKALESLGPTARKVRIYSDSQYLIQGASSWMQGWKAKGWKKSRDPNAKPILNVDLWKQIDELVQLHTVCWSWVRGHSGHPENEICDQMASRLIAMHR